MGCRTGIDDVKAPTSGMAPHRAKPPGTDPYVKGAGGAHFVHRIVVVVLMWQQVQWSCHRAKEKYHGGGWSLTV